MITTNQIRTSFIDFFKQKEHQHIPSSTLVPQNDKSLIFTNAGMVQFKDIFLGKINPSSKRIVTIQKCIRAGGKHNDLKNVGYTNRHHTFFEMLGNFSFGDYFKLEAIQFAWDFLIKVLKIPEEKLWITIFDKDIESEKIWLQIIKINPKRFLKMGTSDNFWSMGNTGPCGPCTEIFYDHGVNIIKTSPISENIRQGERYVEIWNLVFIQYNRLNDGTLDPLPKYSVDTGIGLERIAAILQGFTSNYDIDIFQKIIKFTANLVNIQELSHPSLKVISDHIRSCSFLIADGILPSNEGRGYVLRRIIRRAIRHGYKLGMEKLFFYRLIDILVQTMSGTYPELRIKQLLIAKILKSEETQFQSTLKHGIKIFNTEIQSLKKKIIPGELAFKLYDTYGFPLDLTGDLAKEKGLSVDIKEFDYAMKKQKIRAKKANKFKICNTYSTLNLSDHFTNFLGYIKTSINAIITGIYYNNKSVSQISENKKAILILNQTPFYAESGGQIGDVGEIRLNNSLFKVLNTQKYGNCFLHIGEVIKGTYQIGSCVIAIVNINKRTRISANHSATHLLHSALRQVFNKYVEQKGSLIEANKFRFDFSYKKELTQTDIIIIEDVINEIIRKNLSVKCIETTPQEAKNIGAISLFNEKYNDDVVRVLQIGDFSIELCGGTHVGQTGEIGVFKIINEYGIASGIRRIEAVTGKYAEFYIQKQQEKLFHINRILKSNNRNVLEKVSKLQLTLKRQNQIIEDLKNKISSHTNLQVQKSNIFGITIITNILTDVNMSMLRNQIDQYKLKYKKTIVVLATITNQKPLIAVGVSNSIIDKINAGELINFISEYIGGQGGGRADMAQGGGGNPKNLPLAMKNIFNWIKKKIV